MKNKKRKILTDKCGISIVIGYILLIGISITLSIFVYQWLKTYIPTESPTCDEGTSVLLKKILYDCTPGSEELSVTIKNNGRFSVNGFFIHVSNKTGEELATIDISSKVTIEGRLSRNSVVFSGLSENNLAPGKEETFSFDVTEYGNKLIRVEIIPTRIQEIDGKSRFVSCGDAKVEEVITCSAT
jgi:hypothetical protein